MNFKSIIGAVCACLMVFSYNVGAAIVTIEYSGNITNIYNPLGELDGSGIVAGTSTFTGIVMYDTSVVTTHNVDLGLNGDRTQWNGVTTLITVDGVYDFEFNLDASYVDNWNPGTGTDIFATSIAGGGSNFAFLAAFGFIDLRLGDSSGSVFSDTSLPLNLSLNDFDIRTLILRSGQPNDIKYQIDGEITALSVSAVPIPAAVWLFGSGIIGLIGVARRKKA